MKEGFHGTLGTTLNPPLNVAVYVASLTKLTVGCNSLHLLISHKDNTIIIYTDQFP